MAVARITKAQVIIHDSASRDVIQRIYELGMFHVIAVLEDLKAKEETHLQGLSDEMNFGLSELEGRLRETTRALDILKDYDPAKRPVIENFVTLKERLPRQQMDDVREQFEFLKISKQLQELADTLKRLQEQVGWLHSDAELLQVLLPIPFPLGELRDTTQAKIIIGQIRKEAKPFLVDALAEFEARIYWEEIAEKGQMSYLFVLYLPAESVVPGKHRQDALVSTLEQHGVDRLDLSKYELSIPEEIQRIQQQLAELNAQIAQTNQRLREFLPYIPQFKIIEDYLRNEIERCKNFANFAESEKVYFVEGWLKQQDKQRLAAGLQEFEETTEIIYSDPEPGDETVPVLLENPRWLQPFELVTQMFGSPKYVEPDPTPMLAPFFLIYFGLCLTDAGYGIMLSALMFWLLRKYIMGKGAQQLARLLFYGGLSTIVCGALTGGWWGDLVDLFPSGVVALKNKLILVDPVKQPLIFLAGALALGYLQICYGIFLKIRIRWRKGERLTVLQEDGNWLLLINSVTLLVIVNAAGLNVSTSGRMFSQLLTIIAIASAALRTWITRRDVTNPVKRIVLGILGLYDLTGIFSDVLSYSRLLALGLSSGVIAVLINMVARMLSDSIPVVGLVLGIVIFLGGHVFNLVIAVLGGFIHTARLQFLEFFSKFYESGGQRYIPFRFESKYFDIVE